MESKPTKNILFHILFYSWVIIGIAILAYMGGNHFSALKPSIYFAKVNSPNSRFSIGHILATDCKCSIKVLDSLLARNARSDIPEVVYFIGDGKSAIQDLKNKGYDVHTLSSTELDGIDISGVPTLLISDSRGGIVYAGGYSNERIINTNQVKDKEIVESLLANKVIKNFPIMGCIASQKYRKILDPFSLKYRSAGL